VAANNSILDNYDVMPIFNSIRKILLEILQLIISVVLKKGKSSFVNCYMGP